MSLERWLNAGVSPVEIVRDNIECPEEKVRTDDPAGVGEQGKCRRGLSRNLGDLLALLLIIPASEGSGVTQITPALRLKHQRAIRKGGSLIQIKRVQ